MEEICVPNPVVEEVAAILSHFLETVQHLSGVPCGVGVHKDKAPLHRSERVSHCFGVLGGMR